jgi:hypothetical protein
MAVGRQKTKRPKSGKRQAADGKPWRWQEEDRCQRGLKVARGRQQTEILKRAFGEQKAERPGDGKRRIADGKPEDGRRKADDRVASR